MSRQTTISRSVTLNVMSTTAIGSMEIKPLGDLSSSSILFTFSGHWKCSPRRRAFFASRFMYTSMSIIMAAAPVRLGNSPAYEGVPR